MKKIVLDIFICCIFLFSSIYADSNGIWTYPEDIRSGVFGSDEALSSSDTYTFNNIVYFNSGLIASNIDVNGNIAMSGTLVSGTVPWSRLSGHPSIDAGDGLSGGGVLSTTQTIQLDSNILDGSAFDSRFVNRGGDTMQGNLNMQNNHIQNVRSLSLPSASGSSNNLIIGSEGHMISQNSNRLVLYPNRAGSGSFQIRSHDNGGSFRTDFQIESNGNSRIFGDLRLDGRMTHGEIPWNLLEDYPTISTTNGLVGGGSIQNGLTLSLASNILDGSAFDSRFVNRGGDSMTGTLNMNSNRITNVANAAAAGDALSRSFGDSRYVLEGQSSSISTGMIQNNAVTSAKIATDSVRLTELDTSSVDTRYVNRGGDSMTGTLNMNNNRITNVRNPTQNHHVATKGYVDSVAGGGVSCSTVGFSSLEVSISGLRHQIMPGSISQRCRQLGYDFGFSERQFGEQRGDLGWCGFSNARTAYFDNNAWRTTPGGSCQHGSVRTARCCSIS